VGTGAAPDEATRYFGEKISSVTVFFSAITTGGGTNPAGDSLCKPYIRGSLAMTVSSTHAFW
jgi:hypothetical protein